MTPLFLWQVLPALLAGPPADPAPPDPAPPDSTDDRGYPVLPHGEASSSPEEELRYAETPTEAPALEYADTVEDPGADLQPADATSRPVPPPESVERQHQPALVGHGAVRGRVESPQRFALELKFGPYLPNVDRYWNGEGPGPYEKIYGETDATGNAISDPKQGLGSFVAFDWQFYHLAGPLSLGLSVGYFRDSAKALLAEPMPGESVRSGADKTAFNVVPLALLLGYRFEFLADRFRVPIVPYAKGGLAYGIWWSVNGAKEVSTNSKGEKGRGGSIGWQVNAGGMLRLDFLERGAAGDLDRMTGINHTYVFGEYQISRLSGFNVGKRVDVGADTWLVGLAIEF